MLESAERFANRFPDHPEAANAISRAAERWFDATATTGPRRIAADPAHPVEEVLTAALGRLERLHPAERWAGGHLVSAAMSLLACRLMIDPAPARSAADHHAEHAHRLIEEDWPALPDAAALARRVRLNPDYLSRIYHRRFGVTPAEHLRRRRLDVAAQRLMAGATLTEIAGELGYADGFSLSKAFKQHTGLSPRAWKRQAGG